MNENYFISNYSYKKNGNKPAFQWIYNAYFRMPLYIFSWFSEKNM